jgi:voltage-gated potassium channel
VLQAFLYRLFRRRGHRTFVRRQLGPGVLAAWLTVIVAAHIVAMMLLEELPFFDAVWLTATTVVTVGYGDLAAKTMQGRIATMALLYVGAIFVLAKAVNDWIERKAEQVERKARGAWRWNMTGHILIIGSPGRQPAQAAVFFERLVRTIRATPEIAYKPVELLITAFAETALPPVLAELGVTHWNGAPHEPDSLQAVNAASADAIIVLERSVQDAISDAETFDTIDRLVAQRCQAPIVAECIEDANRARLKRAGARSLVRPMPAYPGMLVRALVAPGSEAIIEDLFTVEGDECRRVDLARPWRGDWSEVATKLIGGGIGTPLAFADPRGTVHMNPVGRSGVEIAALFVVTPESTVDAASRVRALFG